jgi:acyl phosphate:glycerol-3-phosphate acyltransferase
MFAVAFWTLVGFIAGSIPFSIISGKLIAKKDVRNFGDGNPGGMNAVKAGGLKTGLPAILLDIAKGFLPVFFAQRYGMTGWSLIPVCLAPILGHAFSPFLRFHGGKALGTTGGVWLALVGLWVFPIYAILALPATLLQSEDAWSANAGMLALLGYAILSGEAWLVAFTALNAAMIAWTHRHDLVRPPRLRQWVVHIFSGRQA